MQRGFKQSWLCISFVKKALEIATPFQNSAIKTQNDEKKSEAREACARESHTIGRFLSRL